MSETNGHKTIKTADIVYREDLYPRFKPNAQAIQRYAENIEMLPPIEVNQDGILIDGYHRWKAHETAKLEAVPCVVTKTASDMELLMLAIKRNASHGQQLTSEEKKKYAVRFWDQMPVAEICDTLSISRDSFERWTYDKRKAREEEIKQVIFDMWLRCHTHEEIAEAVGADRVTVTERIAEIVGKAQLRLSDNFGNFEPELYSVWNFAKSTNEVKHFGNIPPEIIDNLLYYYTKPGDVVFDPFGGGGSTLDMCEKRKRRCYISDLNPIPARERDIRQHDVTTGLPANLPVPDLVFLDPPYWQQAKEKYSKDKTDLGNVQLEPFLDTIGNIARDVKRKWSKSSNSVGYLSLIIGPWKEDGAKVDLALLCYERISKYLPLCERIIVPYSTQVHGGAFVNKAKEAKQILYLYRDLMVFKWNQSKNQNDS
jgi:DNA modification methylase